MIYKQHFFFARGIDSSYLGIDSCLISRLENNGQNEFKNYVPINSNIQLRKGDRIKVLYDERNNYNFKVLVLGEVNQPGYIPISKNSTTLSEIIRRAGGFTTNASLRFSELYRNNNSYLTLKRMGVEELLDQNISLDEISRQLIELRGIESLKLSRTAIIDFADTLYFNLDNELRTQSGYSIIDFTKLVDSNSYESSYIVQDGDLIIIPRKSEEIYVWGGVKKVGYYPFRNDFTAMDYIEIAGGLAELAYGDDEIYLIKGDSQNWVNISENQDVLVEPGDYIYALKEKPKNFGFYLGRVGSIASILGGIATIILLLTQIGK